MTRIILLGVVVVALIGCEESATRPDPDPPIETVDVDGFRIMRSATVVFEWKESDPLEADTLEMTWPQTLPVRFVWTGASGDSVAPPPDAQMVVTTARADFATWQPSALPFHGTFETGSYPEVETSFRVRLASGTAQLVSTPDLILNVSR